MKAYAKIKEKDSNDVWIEDLNVTNIETAEEEIKEMVNWFNSTLKYGEKPREFVSLTTEDEFNKYVNQ